MIPLQLIRLATDVEALVLDPCFRNTEVESLARELPCPVEWHPGFRLHVDTMAQHPDYRGPEYVELGRTIAHDGYLTPGVIDDCAAYEPVRSTGSEEGVALFGPFRRSLRDILKS